MRCRVASTSSTRPRESPRVSRESRGNFATASFHTGRDLFRSVQAEYEAEHVPWAPIDFPDAAAALKLLEGPMGVVDVLDEECARPGALAASRRVGVVSRHRRDSSLRPFGPDRNAPRRWLGAGSRVEAEDLA